MGVRGSSLVEVNIALLVIAIGLASIVGLFPVGLRESNMAASDTVQSMFADQVFSMLEANASAVTNWTRWCDNFPQDVCKNLSVPTPSGTQPIKTGTYAPFEYLTEDNYIQYDLTVDDHPEYGPYVKRAWLRVSEKKERIGITNCPIYYTEFVYMGM